MTLAWYDPTTNRVSTDKDDPWFTPLGQVWPLNVERKWVGLTNEEIGGLTVFDGLHHVSTPLLAEFIKSIEAKLKEKNS